MDLLLLIPLDFECSSFSLAAGKQRDLPFLPFSFMEGNVPSLQAIYCTRYFENCTRCFGKQQADLQ